MKSNEVGTVVREVIRYAKHQIELSDVIDEIVDGKNMRFVAFDFNYKGHKSYITARYEIGDQVYKSIDMDAGFDRPAGMNNYYNDLVRLISHLRSMFKV